MNNHLGVGAKRARHRPLKLAYGRPPPAQHKTRSPDGDMDCEAMGRHAVVPVSMLNVLLWGPLEISYWVMETSLCRKIWKKEVAVWCRIVHV